MDVNTIVWATDIHMPFAQARQLDKFFEKVNVCGADIFLITGDISDGTHVKTWLSRLEEEINIPIYFVLGNHDFYYRSIHEVTDIVSRLCKKSDKLIWLSEEGVIELDENTALIGHDGWCDGNLGNIYGGVVLNDFHLIQELKPFSRDVRLLAKRCEELAIRTCKHLEINLTKAVEKYKKTIFITHVPPYEKATWHMGKTSEPAFLPWFSSKITGETISGIMAKYPDRELLVLCGHTHGGGEHQPLPNVKVITGKADYYFPDIQELINLWEE